MIRVGYATPTVSTGCLEFSITKSMMPHIGADVHATTIVGIPSESSIFFLSVVSDTELLIPPIM
jgi:hypothetical protein